MISQFINYIPKNEQEAQDQALILDHIKQNPNSYYRTSLAAHVTSSAFVVDPTMNYVLFAHHNIYDSYAWVGGHNDGNENLLEVALQEAKEETGLTDILHDSEDIFTLDVLYVKNHIKHGKYVSDHLHLNATFLLIASMDQPICPQAGENTDVKWFLIDDVVNHITEPRMVLVYLKAFEAIKAIKKGDLYDTSTYRK